MQLLALAERLRLPGEFQPAMTAAPDWQVEDDDWAAYADAVSEYAALERDGLQEAAQALTSGRG